MIGLDGVRPDALMKANTPNIDKLIENGLSSMEAWTQTTGLTDSGPGWASVLTGAEMYKHGDFAVIYELRNKKLKTFLWYAR